MAGNEVQGVPIEARILSRMGYTLMCEISEHRWPIGEPERIAKLCLNVDVDGYHLEIVYKEGGKQ